jgi:hypothetical protein
LGNEITDDVHKRSDIMVRLLFLAVNSFRIYAGRQLGNEGRMLRRWCAAKRKVCMEESSFHASAIPQSGGFAEKLAQLGEQSRVALGVSVIQRGYVVEKGPTFHME